MWQTSTPSQVFLELFLAPSVNKHLFKIRELYFTEVIKQVHITDVEIGDKWVFLFSSGITIGHFIYWAFHL